MYLCKYEETFLGSIAYLEKSARARANLIRQPPEKVLVGRACISGVNPSPLSMMDARAGALSASMFSSWAYNSLSSDESAGSVALGMGNIVLKLTVF